MRILVFGGSGKMGRAVAWDLVRRAEVDAVGLVGRDAGALDGTRAWLASSKASVHELDIANRDGVRALMKGWDVGVSTLPDRRSSYALLESAIDAGLSVVDILEEYHRAPDAYETEDLELPPGTALAAYGERLQQRALERGVTILDGMGFAPGLSNVTVGEGIRKLDVATSAVARVGGIPSKLAAARHPLRYMITWAFAHVLREYAIKVKVRRAGELVEIDATSEREAFRFDALGRDEELECAMTPGMPSFLYTRPELREFSEKTVRWPGHWQGIETLKECGLLDVEPIEVNGQRVVPREILDACIEPRLRPREGETDVCVMYNTVTGSKDGRATRVSYHLWDEADVANGISSMGRVTGFSAAIGAVILGRGLIREKGIVPPEDAIRGELYATFMNELAQRGVRVVESVESLSTSAPAS